MGVTSSSRLSRENTPLKNQRPTRPRTYRPPDVRKKDRFEPLDKDAQVNAFDSTIDKYDYLIVFKITEIKKITSADQDNILALLTRFIKVFIVDDVMDSVKNYRISWKKIVYLWNQAVPGTDEVREAAKNDLANVWENRVYSRPDDDDEIPRNTFMTIAREAIIDQLSRKSGLQLKMTSTNGFLYCRVRAPLKLLEQQAQKESYRLEFKGEIDPGSQQFWNREVHRQRFEKNNPNSSTEQNDESYIALELEEEKKTYDRNEANEILERLYRAGKISPVDLGVNKDDETEVVWSRRVHALERIADQVPIWNEFPAYAPFKKEPHLRYLFQVHPSVRGKTLFRAKDRIYLTKSILDQFFDLEVLVNGEVVYAVMPLHDANRGEKVTIDTLRKRWVTFWTVPVKEIGIHRISKEISEDEKNRVSATSSGGINVSYPDLYLRPFCQPLNDVRDYFGEKIALYYAWFGFYTFSLLFLSVVGVSIDIVYVVKHWSEKDFPFQLTDILFLIFVIVWTVLIKEVWVYEERAIALKWGTVGFEANEKNRPQFHGDHKNPIRRSQVTDRQEIYYPSNKRFIIQSISLFIILLCLIVTIFSIGSIFLLEKYLIQEYSNNMKDNNTISSSWPRYLCAFLLAGQIKVHTFLSSGIIEYLNEWENHQTETTYEDNLIFKTFIFEILNHYGALLITAFIKGIIFNACTNCLDDLRLLLICVFIIRYLSLFYHLSIAIFTNIYYVFKTYTVYDDIKGTVDIQSNNTSNNTSNTTTSGGNDYREELEALNEDTDKYFQEELSRKPSRRFLFKFADMVLQYGYLTLFITIQPSIALLALIENLIAIRLDAWNLCTISRRPHVTITENIGYWDELMTGMGSIALVSNVAIFCFTSNVLNEYSLRDQCLIFIIIEQALLFLKLFIQILLKVSSQDLEDITERQKYIIGKYLYGNEDPDDIELDDKAIRGNLEEVIEGGVGPDAIGTNLRIVTTDGKIAEKTQAKLDELEEYRREYERDLRIVKDQLQAASKTEVYNPLTGIGETKHGLPLGRLTIRLVEMQNLTATACSLVVKDTTTNNTTTNNNQNNNKEMPVPVMIRVHLQDLKKDSKSSTYTKFENTETGVLPLGVIVPFNKSLGPYAPIKSLDTEIIFEVIDITVNSSLAVASVKLRDLADQQQHDKVLHLRVRSNPDYNDAKLFVQLTFLYSNIVPLRTRIYHLQDKIRQNEKEVQALKAGN